MHYVILYAYAICTGYNLLWLFTLHSEFGYRKGIRITRKEIWSSVTPVWNLFTFINRLFKSPYEKKQDGHRKSTEE